MLTLNGLHVVVDSSPTTLLVARGAMQVVRPFRIKVVTKVPGVVGRPTIVENGRCLVKRPDRRVLGRGTVRLRGGLFPDQHRENDLVPPEELPSASYSLNSIAHQSEGDSKSATTWRLLALVRRDNKADPCGFNPPQNRCSALMGSKEP